MAQPTPDDEALKLINDEVTARLARQADAGKTMDTKAGIIAGFAATATTFLAARDFRPWWAVGAFAAFGLAFGLAVWCLRVAQYKDVPNPRALVKGYPFQPKSAALIHLIQERVAAFSHNAAKNKTRMRLWWLAVAALTAGLLSQPVLAERIRTGATARPAGQFVRPLVSTAREN